MELGSGLYSSVCVVTVYQTRPPRNVGSSFHRVQYFFFFFKKSRPRAGPTQPYVRGALVNAAVA